MSYEVYNRASGKALARRRGVLFVSLRDKVLLFNGAAGALLEARRVLLLVDKESGRCAVRATDENDVDGYLWVEQKGQRLVGATNFLRDTGTAGAGKVQAHWDAESKMLWWEIPQAKAKGETK